MRWWGITVLAVCAAPGCQRDEGTSSAPFGSSVPGDECEWRTVPEPRNADEPLCDIEFREAVRLVGDLDGVIPQYPPVTVLRDGRYLTGTYTRGQLALWAPDGDFLDVMGNGPGEGPGEFDSASGFAQAEDDEVLVLTGLPTVHWYSTTGRFLRSLLLPASGGAGSAVVYDGAVITSANTIAGERGFVLRGDTIRDLGLLGPPRSTLLLAGADDVGLWSAEVESGRYVLRSHSWPSGAVSDSLVPDRDWFPGPEGNEAQLGRIQAGGRGLIWTQAVVADPDAPTDGSLSMHEMAFDSEEFRAWADEHRDYVIEAIAPDGRLVASIRFDSASDSPGSLGEHGSIWVRPTEDMLTLVILEAVLTEPG